MNRKEKFNLFFLDKEEYFKEINVFSKGMNVFQTIYWHNFLLKTVDGFPVYLKITKGSHLYFLYGFIFKKMGIKIFASPFEQWTTSYIGFLTDDANPDFKGLINCIFKSLRQKFKIFYLQIADLSFKKEYLKKNHMRYEIFKTQVFDLSKSEEEVFSLVDRRLRKKIRNYKNHGYRVDIVEPTISFAKNYYAQLIDVFALQGLKPFYNEEKVIELIQCFVNTDLILCLESYNENNELLGSAISFGMNDHCITWGSASFTKTKKSSMNHPVRWETIRFWKNKGATIYDFGGFNPYKSIFNPNVVEIYKVYKSVFPGMNLVKKIFRKLLSIKRAKNGKR